MEFDLIKVNKNRYVLKGFSNDLIIIKGSYNLGIYVKEPYYSSSWNTNDGVITRITNGDFSGFILEGSDGCLAKFPPKMGVIRLPRFIINLITDDDLLAVAIKKNDSVIFRRCL